MGVQLNIKDPETVRLARELAGRTGSSMTETIRDALREKVEQQERHDAERLIRLRASIAAARARMTPEMRRMTSEEAQDSLYDDGVSA